MRSMRLNRLIVLILAAAAFAVFPIIGDIVYAANQTGHGTNSNSGGGHGGSGAGNQGGGAGHSGGHGNAGGGQGGNNGGGHGGGNNGGHGGGSGNSGGGNNGGGGTSDGGASGGSSIGTSGGTSGGGSTAVFERDFGRGKRDDATRDKTEAALRFCQSPPQTQGGPLWYGTKQDGSYWVGGYEYEYPFFARCMRALGYQDNMPYLTQEVVGPHYNDLMMNRYVEMRLINNQLVDVEVTRNADGTFSDVK